MQKDVTLDTLEKKIASGDFVITAETTPKATTDLKACLERVMPLRNVVDAVNITDGAGAKSHLSSLILASSMQQNGIEAILQLTLRDKNRIALQSDVLGAASVGIKNFLILTGDPVEVGDEKDSKFVGDFENSTELIELLVKMYEHGVLSSGKKIDLPPQLFVGAADAPFDPPKDWKPVRLEQKLNSGASFFQTQYCFNIDICKKYFTRLSDLGILERSSWLVGIGPFSSAKQALWMDKNLPGVDVPNKIIERLEKAKDQKKEGSKICIEILQQLNEIPGISGAHIMGPNQESAVAEIVIKSKIISKK